MGSWVFSRLPDMFEFFRTDISKGDPRANIGYWAEKCESYDRHNGLRKYDPEYFQEQSIDFENEYESHEFLYRHYPDLLCDGINGYDYTYGYIWICYAIAYGIGWYDNACNGYNEISNGFTVY